MVWTEVAMALSACSRTAWTLAEPWLRLLTSAFAAVTAAVPSAELSGCASYC